MNTYGDIEGEDVVFFHDEDPNWFEAISGVDGARYFQMRFSFVSNITTRQRPVLDALGIAFTEDP